MNPAALDRELLRYAVMRAIFCQRSGVVLDVRTAVLFRVTTPSGASGSEVVTGAAWDEIAEQIRTTCAAKNITLEVIDGRALTNPTGTAAATEKLIL